jgi:hypothetical protein
MGPLGHQTLTAHSRHFLTEQWQELVNTQQLVDAKKNETTTEEHLQV